MEPEAETQTAEEIQKEVDQAFTRWELRDLQRCYERIKEDEEQLNELYDKDVIMVMGNTGAGKSTIVNAMISGVTNMIPDEDNGTYDIKPEFKLMKNDRHMFVIGHQASSCTATPGFYDQKAPNGKQIYFVDCPGFSDNNRNKEFPNRTVVHQIMQKAASVRIALVINYNELICRKGEYAFEVLTTISRLFKAEAIKNTDLILPIINQASEMDAQSKMIDHKFNRTIEFVREKMKVVQKKQSGASLDPKEEDLLNQFNGHDFPSESELGNLAAFLEYMKDNYVVIDPLDDHEEGFADKNKTMEELKNMLLSLKGMAPANCSDSDLPYKLANFLVEDFVEPIREDRLFKKQEGVRTKTVEYWKTILGPWKGPNSDAMVAIMANKKIEADASKKEKWFDWYCNSMYDMISDGFTDDMDAVLNFNPTEDDRTKPIYKLVRRFYFERQQIKMAFQFSSKCTYEDFLWLLNEFVSNMKEEVFRWREYPLPFCPPDVEPGSEKDQTLNTFFDILPHFKKNFLDTPANTKEMQDAFASKLGTSMNVWIKKGWNELYKRQSDEKAIERLMEAENEIPIPPRPQKER